MLSDFLSEILDYGSWFVDTYITPYHDEILALAVFVIAIYAVVLAIATRRQAKDTRILQRAYLSVRPSGIHMLKDRSTAVAHFDICNSGNLPARKTKWFARHILTSEDNWNSLLIDGRLAVGSHIVPPRAKMRQTGDEIVVGPDGLHHQWDGLFLYIWGAVTYDDGFGKNRTTTFCHRYNCVNFTLKPRWGFIAMSSLYAREHQTGNRSD
jgi:hypothetical protein